MLARILSWQHEIAFRYLKTAKENCFFLTLPLKEHVLVSWAACKGAVLFVIPKMVCWCAGRASRLPGHVFVFLLFAAGGVFVFTGSFVYK